MEHFQIALDFVREAGRMAIDLAGERGDLKPDASIITRADRAISARAHEALAGILKDPAHILLDEEDPATPEYLNPERFQKASHVWALDPVDGTRLYANGMPLYGVSLGCVKEGRPWLGVVYFPMLRELFYHDGSAAFFVSEAFTPAQRRVRIEPVDEVISARSLFFCNDTFFRKFDWKDRNFHILISACAVVNLCWPAIGRGVGCFFKARPWDFVGSWPILRAAGLDLRRIGDGKVLDRLAPEDYLTALDPWMMKEYYLMSSASNFDVIKGKIVVK